MSFAKLFRLKRQYRIAAAAFLSVLPAQVNATFCPNSISWIAAMAELKGPVDSGSKFAEEEVVIIDNRKLKISSLRKFLKLNVDAKDKEEPERMHYETLIADALIGGRYQSVFNVLGFAVELAYALRSGHPNYNPKLHATLWDGLEPEIRILFSQAATFEEVWTKIGWPPDRDPKPYAPLSLLPPILRLDPVKSERSP